MKQTYCTTKPLLITLLLVTVIHANCNSSKNQSNHTGITAKEQIELSRSEIFRRLMAEENYEEALQHVTGSFDDNVIYDDENRRTAEYLATAYIYIMLAREQEFLSNHDDISRKILKDSWKASAAMQIQVKSSLYALLNMADKLIEECEQYIVEHEISRGNDYAYTYAGLGYAVKEEYEKARVYLLAAEQSVLLTKNYCDANKIKWNGPDKNMQFLRRPLHFFLSHMTNDYIIRFSRKRPDPPSLIEGEGEKKELYCGFACGFEIVSKKTGKPVDPDEVETMIQEEQRKQRERKVPVDPFMNHSNQLDDSDSP